MTAAAPTAPGTLPRARGLTGYAVGLAALLFVLAWVSWGAAGPAWMLLGYVLVAALVYAGIAFLAPMPRAAREWLEFGVLAVALLGFLAVMYDGSIRSLVPVYTTMAIFAVFALGLNLQFGYTGIINFGHVAFMGLGAYMTALVSLRWVPHASALTAAWPSLAILVATMAVAFVVFGVLASVLVEILLRRRAGAGARRSVLAVGLAGGFLGVLLVFLAVPYPLTPFWAATFVVAAGALLGMVGAGVGGALLGLPALRLRADYFAIVTIGAAEILRNVFRNEQWLTGGPQGVGAIPRPFEGAGVEWPWLQVLADGLGVRSPFALLLLFLGLALLLLLVAAFAILLRSPYGRVLRAIREDEEVPRAVGKNVFRFKLQVLALGSAAAALAGALIAWDGRFINPDFFRPLITFWAWIIIVVGGVGNNKGTILGAIILWTFFAGTQALGVAGGLGLTGPQEGALRIVVIGVLLILLMLFKPEGILGNREEMVLGR